MPDMRRCLADTLIRAVRPTLILSDDRWEFAVEVEIRPSLSPKILGNLSVRRFFQKIIGRCNLSVKPVSFWGNPPGICGIRKSD